jgi:hypothetical protein
MKKEAKKSKKQSSSTKPVTAEEALKRMKSFTERKEKFIASIKKSQN